MWVRCAVDCTKIAAKTRSDESTPTKLLAALNDNIVIDLQRRLTQHGRAVQVRLPQGNEIQQHNSECTHPETANTRTASDQSAATKQQKQRQKHKRPVQRTVNTI